MPSQPGIETVCAARDLVREYGWNSTSYQILNPGIAHWFARGIPAVVGYVRRAGVLLAAGAPVCPPHRLPEVCAAFEEYARREHCSVCYVCAQTRLRDLFAGSPRHAIVTLGGQPAWDPQRWSALIQSRASLRAQLHRARNKSVVVEAVAGKPSSQAELRRVLGEWLETRRLPPLHFLVEPDIFGGDMRDRVVFAARRNGQVVAFLVASPIAARNGYLVELLARCTSAPNGVSELLVDSAMRRFASERRSYLTLGLVALAHAADEEIRHNPLWLRGLMGFARAHANRFYNFRGLEHFRTKMSPQAWEPVYAISTERHFSPRTLYAIGSAFAGMAPWQAVAIGAGMAIRQEIGSAVRRLSGPRSGPQAGWSGR